MHASRDDLSKLEKIGGDALLLGAAGVFLTIGLCVIGYQGARVSASRACAALYNSTIGRFSGRRYEPARIESSDGYFLEASEDPDDYLVPGRIVKKDGPQENRTPDSSV